MAWRNGVDEIPARAPHPCAYSFVPAAGHWEGMRMALWRGSVRRRSVLRRPVAILLVAFILFAVAAPAWAGGSDPWYADVDSQHWGYPYVRSLWESGLTDGWLEEWAVGWTRSFFGPQKSITRSEYAMLLAKTFGLAPEGQSEPVFSDVPAYYRAYVSKPAFGYIQAAAHAGIARGDPWGRFRPDEQISRQEAVAMLVRALDLGPLAEAMPDDEVIRELQRFRDGLSVTPALRREVAVAVKLHILLGYPDGTVHPAGFLGRAEAAAVLYRSALIRATAQPNPFSPDGDGRGDVTSFLLTSLKNGNAASWQLVISLYDESAVLKTFSGAGGTPPSLIWNGQDWAGRPLGSGTYYYRPYLTDRTGQVLTGVLKPITLEVRRLTAVLHPSTAAPGERVTVDARTEGWAQQVSAHFGSQAAPGVGLPPKSPVLQSLNEWVGTLIVPADQPNGVVRVHVRARFAATERWVSLPLLVYDPLWLEAQATPNRLRAGKALTFTAQTSPGITRVSAFWPQGPEIPLEPSAAARWKAIWQVPAETPPGLYAVPVRGWDRGQAVGTVVNVQVDQPERGVQFFLSD